MYVSALVTLALTATTNTFALPVARLQHHQDETTPSLPIIARQVITSLSNPVANTIGGGLGVNAETYVKGLDGSASLAGFTLGAGAFAGAFAGGRLR